MSLSRALGLAGALIVLIGGLLSIASSSILLAPHSSYFIENVTVLISAIASSLLVKARLFRWLIFTAAINALAFAHCISSLAKAALESPPPRASAESLGEIVSGRLIDGVLLLMQTHMGWPIVIVGSIMLAWAGARSPVGFFAQASSQPVGAAEEDLFPILQELSRAPKWPLVYGAFLIILGIFILFVGPEASIIRKLTGALITELGFAFFIAFVIGVSIELRAKVEHDKQISKGLLSYIYGVSLDDDMFVSTEDYVFSTPVFRRDMTVSYDFVKMKDDKVLLKYTLSYLVENVSREPIDYDVHTFVEQPADLDGTEGFENIDVGLQSITIDGAEIKHAEIDKARTRIPNDRDFRQSSYTVKMQPGEKRRVMVVHLIEKCSRDSELWRSLSPCAGLTLIINWNSQSPMEVRAAPVHPSNKFESLVRDDNSVTASLHRPFFPHNGVYFWWSPKREAALQQPSVSEAEAAEPGAAGRNGGATNGSKRRKRRSGDAD